MEKINLKSLVKGTADIVCVNSGGIVVYNITSDDNHIY